VTGADLRWIPRDSVGVDEQIAVLAAAQHGVVALTQLRAIGIRSGAIYHRVRCGRLHQLHRGVFAVGHTPRPRTLKRIVATIHNEPPITRSHLEALMRDLCDQHGLPRPEVNSMVEGEEVDFFWRAQRLIVETDGHATHGTNVAFERDRARDARLTLLGYRVVRFTYQQLTYERDHVAATLRGLLSAA